MKFKSLLKNEVHAVKSLVIFLFIISLSFASDGSCGFGSYIRNGVCVPDVLFNLSTIILLTMTFVVILMYVIGTVLEHQRILSWSKDTLYQLLGTAVIFMIYVSLLSALDLWSGPLLKTNLIKPTESSHRLDYMASTESWTTLREHALSYVECLIGYTKKANSYLIKFVSIISVAISSSIMLSVGQYNQYFPLFPTGGGFTGFASIAVGVIASVLLQLRLQQEFLSSTFQLGLFNVLLPLGLIFRSFPYTRSAGAAMIAIVFGFTIILPVTYLIIEDIGFSFLNNQNVCQMDIDDSFMGLVFKTISLAWKGIVGDDFISILKDELTSNKSMEIIKVVLIQATVLPLAAYLIMLNVMKRLAELMGGEIDFSTLVRLI